MEKKMKTNETEINYMEIDEMEVIKDKDEN